MNKSEIEKKIKQLEANLKNEALKEYHADFEKGVAKLKADLEALGDDAKDEAKPKAKSTRKPRAKKKSTRKPRAKKETPSKDDYESAKKDLAKKLGKTEEECEEIIEQYKELRKKSQARKKKETETKKKQQKRRKELKDKDKVTPEGTKKPEVVIEDATPKVEERVEQKIEKIKEENTPKPTKEKPKPKPTPKQKKKIKEEVEDVVEDSVEAIEDMLKAIMSVVAKHKEKGVGKKILIKLRDELTKEINKMEWGGLTDGATANQNITQSQMSAESVNPQEYARGGRTQGYDDRQDESLGMRRGRESSYSQSDKARREDSYGKWGKRDEENRNISMKRGGTPNWVQKVVNSPNFDKGAFSRKAKNRGMTTTDFMNEVLRNPSSYTMKTRRQAQFMKNAF